MESHAGLHLRLVQTSLPKTSRNRDNPSRQRRRARLATAREEAVKATVENVTKAEEGVKESFAEENSENTAEYSETEGTIAKRTSEQSHDLVYEGNGTN